MYLKPHQLVPGLELRVQVPGVGKQIPSRSVEPRVHSSGWRITAENIMEGSHSGSLSMARNMPGGLCFYYLTSMFSLRSAQNTKRLIIPNSSVQGLTVLGDFLWAQPLHLSTCHCSSVDDVHLHSRFLFCRVLAFSYYGSNMHSLFKNQKIRAKEIN